MSERCIACSRVRPIAVRRAQRCQEIMAILRPTVIYTYQRRDGVCGTCRIKSIPPRRCVACHKIRSIAITSSTRLRQLMSVLHPETQYSYHYGDGICYGCHKKDRLRYCVACGVKRGPPRLHRYGSRLSWMFYIRRGTTNIVRETESVRPVSEAMRGESHRQRPRISAKSLLLRIAPNDLTRMIVLIPPVPWRTINRQSRDSGGSSRGAIRDKEWS